MNICTECGEHYAGTAKLDDEAYEVLGVEYETCCGECVTDALAAAKGCAHLVGVIAHYNALEPLKEVG